MRNSIVRAIVACLRTLLSLCLPGTGRHRAVVKPVSRPTARIEPPTDPAPVSAWSAPWTGPSAHEVRAVFKDERARELSDLQRERYYAAGFAALGVDYDHPTMPLGSVITRQAAA